MTVRVDLRHAATLERVLNDEQVCLIIWMHYDVSCRCGCPAAPVLAAWRWLLLEETLGYLRGRDCQPPVHQCLLEVLPPDLVQLDQEGVVAVEVGDGEE